MGKILPANRHSLLVGRKYLWAAGMKHVTGDVGESYIVANKEIFHSGSHIFHD